MSKANYTFKNPRLGKIRAVSIRDDVYFYGDDICKCLGIHDPEMAMKAILDDDHKTIYEILGDDYRRKMVVTVIDRAGVEYLLATLESKTADKIRNWFEYRIDPAVDESRDFISDMDLDCEVNLVFKD